jgi:catechol 2,3-dioxygenase-like lactoylglutathione lyase family enzyme
MSSVSLKPHHFAIIVDNIDLAIKWYEDKLNFKLEKRFENKELCGQFAFMKFDEIMIEICQFKDSLPLPENAPPNDNMKYHGFNHYAFSVENITIAVKLLKSNGVEFIKEASVGASGNIYAKFLDISGNMLEIIQETNHKH